LREPYCAVVQWADRKFSPAFSAPFVTETRARWILVSGVGLRVTLNVLNPKASRRCDEPVKNKGQKPKRPTARNEIVKDAAGSRRAKHEAEVACRQFNS